MVVDTQRGKINIIEQKFEHLGDGCEADVYRYNINTALKIYKENDFERKLDEKTTLELMRINTKRILLPTEIIYDDQGNMIGYKKDFKENYNHALNRIQGSKLSEEFSMLKEDALLLASYGFIISDLHRDNMIYDGSLYLTDPGSYEKIEDKTINPTIYNIESLNGLIVDDIIGYDLRDFLSMRRANVITTDLRKYKEYLGDVIKEDLEKSKTLRAYTKSLARRY